MSFAEASPLKLDVVGKVFTGRGEGKKYAELAWVKQQIYEKLGFDPFPGTLNLRLDAENVKQKVLLEKNTELRLCYSEGYCTGLLFKASIGGVACGVVIPQVEKYPDEELEVVAEVNLRKELHLSDGDTVMVTVFLSTCFS